MHLFAATLETLVLGLFFAFHLLECVYRFETLKNVLRAITFNARQLGVTMLLLCTIIYLFTIVYFVFFRHTFEYNPRTSGACEAENKVRVLTGEPKKACVQYVCENLLECLLYNLNSGLRQGGGIGDALSMPDFHTGGWARTPKCPDRMTSDFSCPEP